MHRYDVIKLAHHPASSYDADFGYSLRLARIMTEIDGPLYMNRIPEDGSPQIGQIITNGTINFVVVRTWPRIIARLTENWPYSPGRGLIKSAYKSDRALIYAGRVDHTPPVKRPSPDLWEYQPGNMLLIDGPMWELEV